MDQKSNLLKFGLFSIVIHVAVAALVSEFIRDSKLIRVDATNPKQVLQVSINTENRPENQTEPTPTEIHHQTTRKVTQKANPKTADKPLHVAKTERPNRPLSEKTITKHDIHKSVATSAQPELKKTLPRAKPASIVKTESINARNAMIRERLNALINIHKKYPPFAIRRGWQGTVELGLRVEADGKLSRVRVLKTSGYRILDEAALTMLTSADHLNGIEAWLNGHYFDTTLPVEYRLTGG